VLKQCLQYSVCPHPPPPLVGMQAERARIYAQQQVPPALSSVRVCTASYAGPLEKASFQGAVTRETAVFADLIRAKQHLVLPLDMGSNALQQVGCVERLCNGCTKVNVTCCIRWVAPIFVNSTVSLSAAWHV
jgi:hypothetical protein